MVDWYLVAVVILFVLGIGDLIVGVSNDAVNFLNSAVGSRASSRRTILIMASIGVFVGATFSSGLMEVARKGIFNPEMFFLSDIIVIFLAVMLTDIVLLDRFNSLSLPTSTTVSIVFELLGAAVVVSLFKVVQGGGGIASVAAYINGSQALTIIGGIFISVFIAFVVGAFVQFVSRQLFSFEYEKRMRRVGAVWAGFAMTAMSYFLLIKGFKGASFVSTGFLEWVSGNTALLLVGSLVVWTIVAQVLIVRGVNILRPLVLFGTFGLAMAFAGNDLVNFIGVPIAGFESFLSWSGSGADPTAFPMTSLADKVPTRTELLLIAGLVMVVTLWRSRKARSVTDTEVNLSRQDEGIERFRPNALSRGIVRVATGIVRSVAAVTPRSWRRRTEANFVQKPDYSAPADKPAFDLIRATVNLTVASMLIAFATSLKLPLSTTYVSFMVAMGTSMSDRAWGLDSAVFRVSGVLNVIAGWLLTALFAASIAGIFAAILMTFGLPSMVVLLAVVGIAIFRGVKLHRRLESEKEAEAKPIFVRSAEADAAFEDIIGRIGGTLALATELHTKLTDGIIQQDVKLLRKARRRIAKADQEIENLRVGLHRIIEGTAPGDEAIGYHYLRYSDVTQDLLQSLSLLATSCEDHVLNSHKPLIQPQVERLEMLSDRVARVLGHIADSVSGKTNVDAVLREKNALLVELDRLFEEHGMWVQEKRVGRKNSALYLRILTESKDVVAISARYAKNLNRAFDPESVQAYRGKLEASV